MALFLRREIQRRIDEAASFLSSDQLHGLVQRLNKSTKVSIEAQWEVMWLTAFARIGQLRHEASHGGGTSLLDVHFRSNELEFVADITTASDIGYEEDNPMSDFRRALNRLYRKYNSTGFLLKVGSNMVGAYGDRKVKLALPPRPQIDKFLKDNFEPFVKAATQSPSAAARHSVAVSGGTITLDYVPTRKGNQDAGHLSFNVAYSLKRNPVYNALKAKKGQLKKSGFTGLKGIILCDASCNILTTPFPRGVTHSLGDIVREFLDENRSVDFVLVVGVKENHAMCGKSTISFKHELLGQRQMSDRTMGLIEKVLGQALGKIPIPTCAPYKAMYRLERGNPPDARFEALPSSFTHSVHSDFMSSTEMKISNRLLMGLLSGEVTQQQFRWLHEIEGNTGQPPIYLLEEWAQEGRMISEAKVERHEGDDDDYIVLKFGPPDPAASRFRVPQPPQAPNL